MEKHQIRIRKDVRSLGKFQGLRFWWCFRYLAIMAPTQLNIDGQHLKKKFGIPGNIIHQKRALEQQFAFPRTKFDELTAFHASCCQHNWSTFSYWHRHFLINCEIALNKADQEMRDRKITQCSIEITNELKDLYERLFDRYAEILQGFRIERGLSKNDELEILSMHYWNPFDYRSDIDIPKELRQKKQDQKDLIDTLYKIINHHQVWEINLKSRWYRDKEVNLEDFVNIWFPVQSHQKIPRQYSVQAQKILKKIATPRSQSQQNRNLFFQKKFKSEQLVKGNSLTEELLQMANDRQHFQAIGHSKQGQFTVDAIPFEPNEINVILGGGQFRWIKQKQVPLSIDQKKYNELVPYFLMTKSLLIESDKFLEGYTSNQKQLKNFQHPHNLMHNTLGLFMNHPLYSAKTFLFYLYHSWIDFMLELKIRLIRLDQQSAYEAYHGAQIFFNKTMIYSNGRSKKLLDNILGQNQERKNLDYPIFQWIHGNEEAMIGHKTYAQLVTIKQKQLIRQSNELNQVYLQYQINNIKRFKGYKDFLKFNFNFTYDIIPANGKTEQQLVPTYLLEIMNQIRTDKKRLLKGPLIPQPNSMTPYFCGSPEYQKNVIGNIQILYKYPSNMTSKIINVFAKLKDPKQFQDLNSEIIERFKKFYHIYFVANFSKGEQSKYCINCPFQIQKIVNLAQIFAELDPLFFNQLKKRTIQKIIFSSQNPQQVNKTTFKDLIQLTTNQPRFHLQFINGARQIQFHVQLIGNRQLTHKDKIKINVQTKAIGFNRPYHILSKTKYTFPTQFQFPKLYDLDAEYNGQRKIVYTKAVGQITLGKLHKQFEFKIHNYYELIRYKIVIDENLNITISDQDYYKKIRKQE